MDDFRFLLNLHDNSTDVLERIRSYGIGLGKTFSFKIVQINYFSWLVSAGKNCSTSERMSKLFAFNSVKTVLGIVREVNVFIHVENTRENLKVFKNPARKILPNVDPQNGELLQIYSECQKLPVYFVRLLPNIFKISEEWILEFRGPRQTLRKGR